MFISEMLILYEQACFWTRTGLVPNQDIFQPACFEQTCLSARFSVWPYSTPATLALISFVFAMSWKVGKSVYSLILLTERLRPRPSWHAKQKLTLTLPWFSAVFMFLPYFLLLFQGGTFLCRQERCLSYLRKALFATLDCISFSAILFTSLTVRASLTDNWARSAAAQKKLVASCLRV